MDLFDELATNETAKIFFKNPNTDEMLKNENGENFYLEVYGADSEHYFKRKRHHEKSRLKTAAKRRRGEVDVDDIFDSAMELIVECVRDWNLMRDGQYVPCTKEEVRKVFEGKNGHLAYKLVDEFIHDEVNFLKG